MGQMTAINQKIANLPDDQKKEILDLLYELEEAKSKEESRTDFLTFVNKMWPSFIAGRHHQLWLMRLKGWQRVS